MKRRETNDDKIAKLDKQIQALQAKKEKFAQEQKEKEKFALSDNNEKAILEESLNNTKSMRIRRGIGYIQSAGKKSWQGVTFVAQKVATTAKYVKNMIANTLKSADKKVQQGGVSSQENEKKELEVSLNTKSMRIRRGIDKGIGYIQSAGKKSWQGVTFVAQKVATAAKYVGSSLQSIANVTKATGQIVGGYIAEKAKHGWAKLVDVATKVKDQATIFKLRVQEKVLINAQIAVEKKLDALDECSNTDIQELQKKQEIELQLAKIQDRIANAYERMQEYKNKISEVRKPNTKVNNESEAIISSKYSINRKFSN